MNIGGVRAVRIIARGTTVTTRARSLAGYTIRRARRSRRSGAATRYLFGREMGTGPSRCDFGNVDGKPITHGDSPFPVADLFGEILALLVGVHIPAVSDDVDRTAHA